MRIGVSRGKPNEGPFQYNGLGLEIDTPAILEILGDLKQST